MSNEYYNADGTPVYHGPGSSAAVRAEFVAIASAFAMLPPLSGLGGSAVIVNPAGTGLTSTTGALSLAGDFTTTGAFNTTLAQQASATLTLPGTSGTLATLAGSETLTNKTLTAPALGTPVSGVLTNCTGTAAGLTAGNATAAGTATYATTAGIATNQSGGTVSATNGSFSTQLLVGTGTGEGTTKQFESAIDIDPSSGSGNFRRNNFNATLNYSANTTHIWQTLTVFTNIYGPGHANAEIGGILSDHTFNVGSTGVGGDAFESRLDNYGTITNGYAGYLGVISHNVGATASAYYGFQPVLYNLNPTPGSITTYAAIDIEPMQSGGGQPTYYYAMRIADALAGISTLGGINIGGLGNATPNTITIYGQDNSSGTYPLLIKNLAGSAVLVASNNGNVDFASGHIDSTGLLLNGKDNSSGTYPLVVKNLSGTSVISVSNSGVVAVASLQVAGVLAVTGAVSGAGITALHASPGPIGSTAASTGAFTTLAASGTVSGTGFSTYLASPPAIGGTAPAAAAFTTLSASGAVSGAGMTAFVRNGTATNDSASAGQIGEYVSSTVLAGSAVSLTNSAATDVTSISLTAGDWDVWGSAAFTPDGTTITTSLASWLSSTSATVPTNPNSGGELIWIGSATGITPTISAGRRRFSLAGTTTIYLTIYPQFTVSTLAGYGFIGARRAR